MLMHNELTFGKYSCTSTQVFIPYWNFEYTKAVTVHCGKVGGGMGQEQTLLYRFCQA